MGGFGRACVAWLTLAGTLCGQTVGDLWARAEEVRRSAAADPAVVRQGYARALAAFDALDESDPARRASVALAAHSALLAGEPARALSLARAAEQAAGTVALAIETRLRALADLAQVDAFVAALRADARADAAAVGRACAEVVASHGGAVCEAADRALREGRSEDGLFVFEALVEATGRAPVALANLALALRHLGRLEASEALYREALQASPRDPDLWNDYGLMLKGQRRDGEAMAAFAQSHALDPTVPPTGPAVSNLAFMQARGRGGDAGVDGLRHPVAALSDVVARRPDAMMARRLLIDALVDPARFQGRLPDRDRAGR